MILTYEWPTVYLIICMSIVFGTGNAWMDSVIREWPDVSALKSCRSDEEAVISLELRIPSIRVVRVWNSSYIKTFYPTTWLRWYFVLLMLASQMLLKWGVAGGLKASWEIKAKRKIYDNTYRILVNDEKRCINSRTGGDMVTDNTTPTSRLVSGNWSGLDGTKFDLGHWSSDKRKKSGPSQ